MISGEKDDVLAVTGAFIPLVDDEMWILGAGDSRDCHYRHECAQAEIFGHQMSMTKETEVTEATVFTTKKRSKRRRTENLAQRPLRPQRRHKTGSLGVRRHALRASGERRSRKCKQLTHPMLLVFATPALPCWPAE